jgi:uncharacterized protein (TIGR02611 family)
MVQNALRGLRIVAGVALVAIGAVLAVPGVPGPGLAVAFGGLTLLGQEFEWARRITLWLRRSTRRMLRKNHDR